MKPEFGRILELLRKEDFPTVEKVRRVAEGALPGKLTHSDVVEFIDNVYLEEFDYPGFLGIILSVAVSRLPKGDYEFKLDERWKGVDFLFSGLEKGLRITVEGDVGNLFGWNLRGAEITLKGNAGHELGAEMEGGKIEVFGDVGDYAGSYMRGGEVLIHGNAGGYVGHRMSGGRIVVEGRGRETKLRYGGELVIRG
ncbi:MAG: hypothetical protein J7J79_01525 [Thermoplasmata archaeon]|nr:hypothetical protein [Thermoplasmata archaeon]